MQQGLGTWLRTDAKAAAAAKAVALDVKLTIDGRSTARCRALIAIMSFVVLNRATESSLSEMVYRSA